MKKFLAVLISFLLISGLRAQQKSFDLLAGSWEAVDSENSSGGLQVVDSTKIFLVYGDEKKAVSSFKIDFSKSPAWFDFTINDGSQTMQLKSLIQFINDDLIQWQVFESDFRPAHFTQNSGQMVYLRRKK